MVKEYLNAALQFAFPALIALILVFIAASSLSSRISRRKLETRQAQEEQLRRKVYAERYRPGAVSEQRPDTDDSLLASRPIQPATNPRASSRPFGSDFMTMSDLRLRITGPSDSCAKGSCCG